LESSHDETPLFLRKTIESPIDQSDKLDRALREFSVRFHILIRRRADAVFISIKALNSPFVFNLVFEIR
jgi:hypothetical protein